MKSLYQILTEGNIGDLKNIKKIRHYTTLNNLRDIINDGYIEARISAGDSDWSDYDIGEDAVVSFHDARTDPELELLIDANKNKHILRRTKTLGYHMPDICAFIEYDFDLLPKKIKEKVDFIKILEHYVPEFTRLWNKLCEIHNIALKNNIVDYESLLTYLKSNNQFELHNLIGYVYQTLDDSERAKFIEIVTRKNIKAYSKSDEKALLNAAIKDDEKLVFNILKQHGWSSGDEDLEYFYRLADDANNTFVDYLKKKFLKTNNEKVNIEIRIAHDMPINIKCCTIHFFKGVADKIEEIGTGAIPGYIDFLKKLILMPNVEIYKPSDDYSLIN